MRPWHSPSYGPIIMDPYNGPCREVFLDFLKEVEAREDRLESILDNYRDSFSSLIVAAKRDEAKRWASEVRAKLFRLGVIKFRDQVVRDQEAVERREGVLHIGALPFERFEVSLHE